MAEVLDYYIQNNLGLFSGPGGVNQNAVLLSNGSFLTLIGTHYGATKSKKITIGSDSIGWIENTVSSYQNRDFNDIKEPGPLAHLFEVPKWYSYPYLAVLAPHTTSVNNLEVYTGIDNDSGGIDWTKQSNPLFQTNSVTNYWAAACATNSSLLAFSPNVATGADEGNLLLSNYDLPGLLAAAEVSESTYNYYPIGACYSDIDGEAGVVMATKGSGSVPIGLAFVPYSIQDRSFGTAVQLNIASGVSDGGQSSVDIAFDKENGRIIIFSSFLDADDDPVFRLVYELLVSDDGGSTWTVLNLGTESLLGGSSDWSWEGYYMARPRLMAGVNGGFVLGYTRKNSAGKARPYVHEVTKVASGDDIKGYKIGAAKELGGSIGPWNNNKDMSGPMFFKAPADMWTNINPIQNIYIGWQADNGTLIYTRYPQQSSKSSGFIMERLGENAYPLEDSYTYATESAGTGEIVCSMTILNTPTEHVDFYDQGYTGEYSEAAVNAFTRYGTTVTIKQYDPRDNVFIGGRGAYKNPVEHLVKVFTNAVTWENPQQALNKADFTEYIDKDLRKIYLPPAFFLEYKYGTNQSELQTKTIYLCELDGFTYEIRQVVPKFVNNQITHWEANCYNVGNFNVWSRGGGQA